MITVLFLDELKLSSELTEAANNAAALPSRDVSKEAFYFGILSSIILPGATVLGFSRSEKKLWDLANIPLKVLGNFLTLIPRNVGSLNPNFYLAFNCLQCSIFNKYKK